MTVLNRRSLLRLGGTAVGLGSVLATSPWWLRSVGAAPPAGREQRRLANRLELWSAYSRKTHENLMARYASERSSSLLREDLVGGGSLAFIAPATLVLRDDGATGSTTIITPGRVAIEPNDPSLPRRTLPAREDAPALRWLADHLLACFAPGDGEALLAGARVEVPRSSTPRLALMPLRESAARTVVRSMTLTFDQVGGAVVRIEIAEADGGLYVLRLSDHRQDLEDEALRRVVDGANLGG